MANASIIDIGGVQWGVKDQEARDNIVTLDDRISAIEGKEYRDLSWVVKTQNNIIFTGSEGGQVKTIFEIPSFNLDKSGRFLLIINCIRIKISDSIYQFVLRLSVNGKLKKEFYNSSQTTNDSLINGVIAIELKEGINNLSIEGMTTGGKEVTVYSSISDPFLCSLIQLS